MNDFTGDPYYHVRDSITDRIIEIEEISWKIDSSSEREEAAILKSVGASIRVWTTSGYNTCSGVEIE